MSQALRTAELPSEAVELIRAGNPRSLAERASLVEANSPDVSGVVMESVNNYRSTALPAGETTPAHRATAELAAKPHKPRLREREAEPVPSGAIASASFRLPAAIPNALLRASVERKIKKIKPWSQQDIAAEALTQWLKRNGYSD